MNKEVGGREEVRNRKQDEMEKTFAVPSLPSSHSHFGWFLVFFFFLFYPLSLCLSHVQVSLSIWIIYEQKSEH